MSPTVRVIVVLDPAARDPDLWSRIRSELPHVWRGLRRQRSNGRDGTVLVVDGDVLLLLRTVERSRVRRWLRALEPYRPDSMTVIGRPDALGAVRPLLPAHVELRSVL